MDKNKMWITKFGITKKTHYIYNMKITTKQPNELIHKGKQAWLKYKYGVIYNGKMIYFKHIQAARNFHQTIYNNQLKQTK